MIDVCILRLFGNTSRSFFLVIEFQNVVIALSRFIEWRVDGLRPMPRRVYIVHRVVGGVGVQVLCPRAVRIAAHRILLNGDPYSPIVPQKEPLQALFSSSIPVSLFLIVSVPRLLLPSLFQSLALPHIFVLSFHNC